MFTCVKILKLYINTENVLYFLNFVCKSCIRQFQDIIVSESVLLPGQNILTTKGENVGVLGLGASHLITTPLPLEIEIKSGLLQQI